MVLRERNLNSIADQSKASLCEFPLRLCMLPLLIISRAGSPYTLSYMSQVALNYKRSRWRWLADPSLAATSIIGNFILALIIGSLYYNLRR